jgi:DNA-binding XRE family transcriptional regulator
MAAESRAAGRKRAAQAVAARRGELGMDRGELADTAGVDPKTLYNLEVKGRWPIAVTRAKIEKALHWQSGEMERIASQAAEEEPEPAIPQSLLREIMETEGLTDEERVAVIAAIDNTLAKERGERASSSPGAAAARHRPAS